MLSCIWRTEEEQAQGTGAEKACGDGAGWEGLKIRRGAECGGAVDLRKRCRE